jgi:hypothetical protein
VAKHRGKADSPAHYASQDSLVLPKFRRFPVRTDVLQIFCHFSTFLRMGFFYLIPNFLHMNQDHRSGARAATDLATPG